MITFHYLTDFCLKNEDEVARWIEFSIHQEEKELGEIAFVFCTDEYLLEKNIKYLKHNTLTDVIGLDYSLKDLLSGDIFISIDRVNDNAKDLDIQFDNELQRVMIHGVLHFAGYRDKNKNDKGIMQSKEDYYLSLRTF